jgi:hypothetical protein
LPLREAQRTERAVGVADEMVRPRANHAFNCCSTWRASSSMVKAGAGGGSGAAP